MLLNEEWNKRLLEANLASIKISIDGRTPEENDAQRLGAKYEVVRRNVLELIRMAEGTQTQVSVANTLLAQNEAELRQAFHSPKPPEFLVRDFGVDRISVSYAMKWPGHDREALDKLGMQVLENGYTSRNYCTMPFTEMSFRWNGDVVMCCYDITGEHVMGNIMEQDLLDIWNGEKYRDVRRAMGSFQRYGTLPPVCQQCPIYTKEMLVAKNDNDVDTLESGA